MAFNSNESRAEYTATTAQTDFVFTFKIFAGEDILVYQTPSGNEADDVADLLVLTTDYTVTIDGDNGGTVILNSGAGNGDKITLLRSLAVTRETDYQNGGDLLAETIDNDQNYQTYLVADLKSSQDRFLKLPTSLQSFSATLPTPVSNSYLRWNTGANALENDTTIPAAVTTSSDNVLNTNSYANEAVDVPVKVFTNGVGVARDPVVYSAKHYSIKALGFSDDAELEKWDAEAKALTSLSYATEPEDTPVNVFTSDGDGTFTATPQGGVFSSLHYANKSASLNVDTKLFATAGGTANAITLSIPAILAYSVNSIFMFKATDTNTTAATADVNGLGIKNIVIDGVALVGGEIETGKEYFLRYTGTNYELIDFGSLNINNLSDKPTPENADNLALQETGGLLKKLSFANLKLWILSLFNPSLTGTVSFNSTTNNINLTNIVTALGLEIGDVIRISGATDLKNNSEFTVEVITDANNIIVNQGHSNKGTTKNVATRASDTGVTVKLLVKYYNAPPSLGRDYVSMSASRLHNTSYTNNTKREMIVCAELGQANTQGCAALVDSKRVAYSINVQTSISSGVNFTVPAGSSYLVNNNSIGGTTVTNWHELR